MKMNKLVSVSKTLTWPCNSRFCFHCLSVVRGGFQNIEVLFSRNFNVPVLAYIVQHGTHFNDLAHLSWRDDPDFTMQHMEATLQLANTSFHHTSGFLVCSGIQ